MSRCNATGMNYRRNGRDSGRIPRNYKVEGVDIEMLGFKFNPRPSRQKAAEIELRIAGSSLHYMTLDLTSTYLQTVHCLNCTVFHDFA